MQEPFISVYVPENQPLHKSRNRSKSLRRWWNRLSRLQKSLIFMSLLLFAVFGLLFSGLSSGHSSNFNEEKLNSGNFNLNENKNDNSQSKIIHDQIQEPPNKKDDPIPNNVKNKEEGQINKPQHQQVETIKPYLENMKLERKFKQDMETLRPNELSLATSPRALKPDVIDDDIDNNNKKSGGKNPGRVAEDIRHVISLDPVIPWNNHKKSKSEETVIVKNPKILGNIFYKTEGRLKFEGPKTERSTAVVDAFKHAWKGYKKYAWGRDHLQPIYGSGQDWFGLGLTLIDSLDTIYIMGLQKEFFEARDWVEENLSFNIAKNVNLFETTIRVLGGLLSAYHLSNEQVFLDKAKVLGDSLIVGFKTPSGIPFSDVNLLKGTAKGPSWNPDSTTSEVSTIQLEFRDLSRSSKNAIYEEASFNVSKRIHKEDKLEGLVPIHISPITGNFRPFSMITLGARGDSYYEYLLKQWIQTGKTIDFLRDDYMLAVEGMKNRLLRKTLISNLTYLGELDSGGKTFRPKMDHLVCYLPGTLALGYAHGFPSWHLDLAKELLYTCYQTYKRNPTGLAAEITFFNTESDSDTDFYVKQNDAHNLLRPETVESLWYLYRVTGDEKYRDWGWEIFQSFMKYTKAPHGFSSINSVLHPNDVRPRDIMESFFLAETLKYFYLLFEDYPYFDLSKWVFNSEAHPLPVYDK